MHRKFLIFSRFCCVFGVLSGLVVLLASIFEWDLTGRIPAPIAYVMLISVLLTSVCLLIGFGLDIMSHLIRNDLSAVMWLFAFTVVFAVIQIAIGLINQTTLDYTMILYSSFVGGAALRGLWYIIGIRSYEIKFK